MIRQCRELLTHLTPLAGDCGRLCGAACCESLEGEETGMLLFPGEEAFYTGVPWARLKETDSGTLLICSGTCDRELRPLACRIYPLLPKVTPEGIRVVRDARAKAHCPLARKKLDAFHPDFIDGVRRVGEMMLQDDTLRPFLEEMTRRQNDLIALRKELGGI